MFDKEYALILTAVIINKDETEIERIDELLKGPIDWIEVTGQLVNNRLAGYFYNGLNKEQLNLIPSELKETLKLLVSKQEIVSLEKLEMISPVLDELDNNGILYCALKGLLFNATMYHVGTRRSNDIDLLVYESHLDEFDRIMRMFGFVQTFNTEGVLIESSKREKLIQRMNYHDLVPYVLKKKDNCLVIDVNFLFDSKDNLIDKNVFDFGTAIYNNGPVQVKGLHMYTNLAFLCIHFHREGTNSLWTEYNRDLPLYKIVDIMNTIRKFKNEIIIDEWIKLVKALNIDTKCFYTFYVLSQFYKDDFVLEIEKRLKPDDIQFVDEIVVEGDKHVLKREEKFIDSAFRYLHK